MNELLSLQIINIVQETPDTRTFMLQNTRNEPLPYQAGQFLTFVFEVSGQEVRRSFSLSSAPETDSLLAITVRRIPNGEVTRLLFDHYQPGDLLFAMPPSGRFTLDTDPDQERDIFLIGAGSGITPLFSLLKKGLYTEKKSHITLIYSNRNEKTAIFFDAINQLATQHTDRFTPIHLLSNPAPAYHHLRGRLNKDLLQQLTTQNRHFQEKDALFYLCGPGDFMRNATIALVAAGYHKTQIKTEAYVIKPVISLSVDTSPKRVRLVFRSLEYDLTLHGESILQAALNAGIRLPYSCRGGRCSACVAVCKSGKVTMQVNEVLTDRDLAEGYILTCTGHPESEMSEIVV